MPRLGARGAGGELPPGGFRGQEAIAGVDERRRLGVAPAVGGAGEIEAVHGGRHGRPFAFGAGKKGRRRSGALFAGSGGLEVDGAGLAALVVLEVVAEALILVQRRHPGALDGRNVDEGVVAAALGLDEAVALVGVEEFDCADRHGVFLRYQECRRSRSAAPGFSSVKRRKNRPKREISVACDFSEVLMHCFWRNSKGRIDLARSLPITLRIAAPRRPSFAERITRGGGRPREGGEGASAARRGAEVDKVDTRSRARRPPRERGAATARAQTLGGPGASDSRFRFCSIGRLEQTKSYFASIALGRASVAGKERKLVHAEGAEAWERRCPIRKQCIFVPFHSSA